MFTLVLTQICDDCDVERDTEPCESCDGTFCIACMPNHDCINNPDDAVSVNGE